MLQQAEQKKALVLSLLQGCSLILQLESICLQYIIGQHSKFLKIYTL
ncbi:hypothetical protein C942_00675 [Photobacterium marinum]|uniref:Uncharacterized protein n=1 Tax=Photobacterium marinum TaxID=1056511 RepID=L8JDV2_9GAMM|nr:hypothetical protein C942_00675 [Photobacterium marinum]